MATRLAEELASARRLTQLVQLYITPVPVVAAVAVPEVVVVVVVVPVVVVPVTPALARSFLMEAVSPFLRVMVSVRLEVLT